MITLRGDPRFEKLVEEAKKPVPLKSIGYLYGGCAGSPRH